MSASKKTTHALFGLLAAVVLVAGGCGSGPGSTSSASQQGTITAPPKATYRAAASLAGPITVGHVVEPLSGLPLDLAANGYVEHEFFASGTATAFKATSAPSNGRWTIAADDNGPLPNEDLGAPADRPGPVQRHRGGRVDERHRRRVGP